MSLFDKHFPADATNICAECGGEFPVSEMNFIDDYGWICHNCSDSSDMVRCSKCYDLYAPEDCSKLDDGTYVCMDCDGDLYWSTHE